MSKIEETTNIEIIFPSVSDIGKMTDGMYNDCI